MKKMIILASLLLCTSLRADDPTTWLDQQRQELARKVSKADGDLEQARLTAEKSRKVKVKRCLTTYLKALKKVQSYWVKQGNFKKAVAVNAEIVSIESLLKFRKPVKKKAPKPTKKIVTKRYQKPKPRGRVITRRIYLPGGGPNELKSDSEVQ